MMCMMQLISLHGTPYLSESDIRGERLPLSYDDLAKIGGKISKLGRTIKIRTTDTGEVVYESDRDRWVACQR